MKRKRGKFFVNGVLRGPGGGRFPETNGPGNNPIQTGGGDQTRARAQTPGDPHGVGWAGAPGLAKPGDPARARSLGPGAARGDGGTPVDGGGGPPVTKQWGKRRGGPAGRKTAGIDRRAAVSRGSWGRRARTGTAHPDGGLDNRGNWAAGPPRVETPRGQGAAAGLRGFWGLERGRGGG